MGARASEITNLTSVYSTVYSGASSSGAGEFPAQMASKAESVSIWWCHHALLMFAPLFEYFPENLPEIESGLLKGMEDGILLQVF